MGDRIHDISLIIDQLPIFADLTTGEVTQLAGFFRLRKWGAGQTIFAEGENSHELIFTLMGSVSIRKKDRNGLSREIAKLEGKQVIGEAAFVDGSLRSATAVALSECVGIVMNQDLLDTVCNTNAPLGIKLLKKINRLLALKLRKTSREFADVLNGAPRQGPPPAPVAAAAPPPEANAGAGTEVP